MADSRQSRLEEKAIAAYWGLAIGDALGATVEFMTPHEIKHQYGVHKTICGGGWLRLKPGQVTDDTEMALALGEAILEQRRLDAYAVAKAFDKWLRSKPVDVGQTVRRGIVHFRQTGKSEMKPSAADAGNGACMRILPVALSTLGCSHAQIEQAATIQAHITHNNRLSDAACIFIVELVHAALSGTDKRELINGLIARFQQNFPEFRYRQRRMDNPSGYIVETMVAVLQAFIDTDSFEECLVDVVNRGGDADTSGAIAGMIAGAYYGLQGIPLEWITTLDGRIRDTCRNQVGFLLSLSKLPAAGSTRATRLATTGVYG